MLSRSSIAALASASLWCLSWLAARSRRRKIARYAALPCVHALTLLEARQFAGNDSTGGCKGRKLFLHFFEWYTGFLGDLEIKSLTIFPQASEDFDHYGPLETFFSSAAPRIAAKLRRRCLIARRRTLLARRWCERCRRLPLPGPPSAFRTSRGGGWPASQAAARPCAGT